MITDGLFNSENMFKEYPDILTIKQLCKMLNICTKTAYGLIRNGEIFSFKIGVNYKIPKESVIEYINNKEYLD